LQSGVPGGCGQAEAFRRRAISRIASFGAATADAVLKVLACGTCKIPVFAFGPSKIFASPSFAVMLTVEGYFVAVHAHGRLLWVDHLSETMLIAGEEKEFLIAASLVFLRIGGYI